VLYLHHPSSFEHDPRGHLPEHPDAPERLALVEAAMAAAGWLGCEPVEARAATASELELVHTPEHVRTIAELCAVGGGRIDADTFVGEASYAAALHAAGASCEMVRALIKGAASSAFCGIRPAGHHAEPDVAMGFCLFNNIAIAAQHALDSYGAGRVAILDWDVHHGNGTNDIFHRSREVLFISIHQSPLYPGTGPLQDVGSGDGEGYTINLPTPPGSGEPTWLSLVEHIAIPAIRAFEPGLILVSAGFDAHRADPLAQCRLEAESFAKMATWVKALANELGVPFGALLEGGYDLEALSTSVAVTLDAFTNGGEPEHVERDHVTQRAAELTGRWWPVKA
jgi:acetoin utilization deacetylase AcuC-like enzyme